MKTHKSICAGVNITISNLILREGRYLGGRERRTLEVEKGGHYHVTFKKIGGGKNLTVYLICST